MVEARDETLASPSPQPVPHPPSGDPMKSRKPNLDGFVAADHSRT